MPEKDEQLRQAERLGEYGIFEDDILERVGEIATRQSRSSWAQIREGLPESRVFEAEGSNPVEVLDIRPAEHSETLVYLLPMANGLLEHMLARMATLSAMHPDARVVAVGNPGSDGPYGKLKLGQLTDLASGYLRAAVEPTLSYLNWQGIETAAHAGESYGAEKASSSAVYAEKYDQSVDRGVFIEPVALKWRSILRLALDFKRAEPQLEPYQYAADSALFDEAWKLSQKQFHGALGFALGLLRLSNIAIASSLRKPGFEWRTNLGMGTNKEMRASIIWGSDSELADDDLVRQVITRLQTMYGYGDRIRGIRVKGGHHAMSHDLYLHTALVAQGLKEARPAPGDDRLDD